MRVIFGTVDGHAISRILPSFLISIFWTAILFFCGEVILPGDWSKQEDVVALKDFLSSFAVNLAFFAFIGIFVFLASLARIEYEPLSAKVYQLFSVRNSTRDAENYLIDAIKSLAAFYKSGDLKFTISDFDEEKRVFRVEVRLTLRVVNLFRNSKYQDSTFPVRVVPSSGPEFADGEVIGGISLVKETIFRTEAEDKKVLHLNDEEKILMGENPTFEADYQFEIPEDGELEREMIYWFKNKVGEDIYTNNVFYGEDMNFSFVNTTVRNVRVSYRIVDRPHARSANYREPKFIDVGQVGASASGKAGLTIEPLMAGPEKQFEFRLDFDNPRP